MGNDLGLHRFHDLRAAQVDLLYWHWCVQRHNWNQSSTDTSRVQPLNGVENLKD
jgi:hypothetical protein